MFAPSFGRVVRSTTAISTVSASSLCRAAFPAAQQASRPHHQRRLSSSKPSNKKKPAEELEQNAANPLQGQKPDAKAVGNTPLKALPESKSASKATKTAKSPPRIPRVPATDYLTEPDVRLTTFFAPHRPLNPRGEAWQPLASMDVFNDVLKRNESNNAQTIQQFLQELHAGIDAREEMHEVVYMQEQGQPKPLTEADIMFQVSQLPPFTPPPPPVVFDPFQGQARQETSPPVEHTSEVPLPFEKAKRRTTFRDHVHRRRAGMYTISVKRQRKLKMKKHKYKKLMKRTRLERRKLDR